MRAVVVCGALLALAAACPLGIIAAQWVEDDTLCMLYHRQCNENPARQLGAKLERLFKL